MRLIENYISKDKRDARYHELRKQGKNVIRSTMAPCQLHPQYVKDFVGPEKDDTFVENMVYKMYFPRLYILEEAI